LNVRKQMKSQMQDETYLNFVISLLSSFDLILSSPLMEKLRLLTLIPLSFAYNFNVHHELIF
jgi:hypothetical protein